MSLTLGEKLRQAREESGITLSEVAEQTRISPLYLESIDNNDYRALPGGIFNKGFVKSYAKYVGLDEHEALMDYSAIVAESESAEEEKMKLYQPQVLTDDRAGSSMMPTIILAAVILALMTGGILYGVSYLRQPAEPTPANKQAANSNSNNAQPANTSITTPTDGVPDMATLKVEFKTTTQPVRLTAITDGVKSDKVVTAGNSATFEPKESITLNYNRWNAAVVQLTINGKPIVLPSAPIGNPKSQRIEFTISKDNLAQIWQAGTISIEVPQANTDAKVNVAPANGAAPPAATKPNPATKPSTPANTATKPTPERKPIETPKPTFPRKVIIIGNANRPQ